MDSGFNIKTLDSTESPAALLYEIINNKETMVNLYKNTDAAIKSLCSVFGLYCYLSENGELKSDVLHVLKLYASVNNTDLIDHAINLVNMLCYNDTKHTKDESLYSRRCRGRNDFEIDLFEAKNVLDVYKNYLLKTDDMKKVSGKLKLFWLIGLVTIDHIVFGRELISYKLRKGPKVTQYIIYVYAALAVIGELIDKLNYATYLYKNKIDSGPYRSPTQDLLIDDWAPWTPKRIFMKTICDKNTQT